VTLLDDLGHNPPPLPLRIHWSIPPAFTALDQRGPQRHRLYPPRESTIPAATDFHEHNERPVESGKRPALLHKRGDGHGQLRPVCCLDGLGEFGERCWELVVRVKVDGQFEFRGAGWDERMSCTDHSR